MLFRKRPLQLQLPIGGDRQDDQDLGRLNRWAIVVIGGALATVVGTAAIRLITPTTHPRSLEGTLILTQGVNTWLLGASGEGASISIEPPSRHLRSPIVDFQTGHVSTASSPPQGLSYSSANRAFIAATDMEALVSRHRFRVDSRLGWYSVVGKPLRASRISRRFSYSAPSVSPDGTRLAYEKMTYEIFPHEVNNGPGIGSGPPSLWVGPVHGCCDSSVLANAQIWFTGGAPAWSPDGRYIASACAVPHHNQALCVVDLRKHRVITPVLDLGGPSHPSWSPHGLTLAFVAARGGPFPDHEIYTYDLANHRTTQLTSDAFGKTAVAWSPSGSEIAYVGAGGVRLISATRANRMLGLLVRGDSQVPGRGVARRLDRRLLRPR